MNSIIPLQADITGVGFELGGGLVIGGVVGYAAKKIAKLVAILIGLEFAILGYFANQGVITVHWDKLAGSSEDAAGAGADATMTVADKLFSIFTGVLPAGTGFTLGAIAGFKKG